MDFPEAYKSTNVAQGAVLAIHDGDGNKLDLVRDEQRNLRRFLLGMAGR